MDPPNDRRRIVRSAGLVESAAGGAAVVRAKFRDPDALVRPRVVELGDVPDGVVDVGFVDVHCYDVDLGFALFAVGGVEEDGKPACVVCVGEGGGDELCFWVGHAEEC